MFPRASCRPHVLYLVAHACSCRDLRLSFFLRYYRLVDHHTSVLSLFQYLVHYMGGGSTAHADSFSHIKIIGVIKYVRSVPG
jgi:hypothetical protein